MPSDPDYYGRVNPDLLRLIPADARAVLEVGCGAGALGAAWKREHPQTRYYGIEAMEQPAEQARQVLDRVICADVEGVVDEFEDLPPLDCLIYGDVLEHLRDPWSCLQRHCAWLRQGGTVLACIPNVQHWSTLLLLLQGEWPLQEEGLFDRTHLRWFTRAGVIRLMRGAGLELQMIQPRIFQPEQALAFVEKLAPALPRLGIDPNRLLRGVAPLQYVIVARKPPAREICIPALDYPARSAQGSQAT